MRCAERAEPKGMCISMLRNEGLLRDIWKAGRVSTAVRYIDLSSTEFSRFHACRFRYSGGVAACDREVTSSCSRRSVAFA
jgi:hypothetical protein